MSEVRCAACSAALSSPELQDGWCDSCGKAVPMFVYHQAGLKGPKEKALPRIIASAPHSTATMEPDERPPIWQLALIGLAAVAIVVVIVFALV